MPTTSVTSAQPERFRSDHGRTPALTPFGWLCVILTFPLTLIAQTPTGVSNELPAFATTQLARSLDEARAYARNPWRDTPPLNDDGTVNGYVEISRGDRRKWEFRMATNKRAIDRMIPEQVGGYPVNYGFVPQTVSYDGDPFDVLVLGPRIGGGTMVRGVIVGLMLMEDEKGYDAKVVISRVTKGRPHYLLTERDRHEIGDYFERYKLFEAGKFSRVSGWGSIEEGRALVNMTHAFFEQCQKVAGPTCRVAPLVAGSELRPAVKPQ
jgi:inorganic pyrophosphatase